MQTSTSGSVTVSTIDPASVSGSFDLAFPNGDSVTGRFSAPLCVLTLPGDLMPTRLVCLP